MKGMFLRLDQLAAEVNAWLLVVAIGLSTLDGTVLLALHGPAAVALVARDIGLVHEARDDVAPVWASSAMDDWLTPPLWAR